MSPPDPAAPRPAFVVMGVSGSGKSACGAALAAKLGIDFLDGDSLHPTTNVAKMRGGTPLTDEDRWPWLDLVGQALGERERDPQGIVIACSALRRRYRDRIRAEAGDAVPLFIFLAIAPETARERLDRRPGHFMPLSLVDSQFETLEPPAADERDVITIIETGTIEETVLSIVAALATGLRE